MPAPRQLSLTRALIQTAFPAPVADDHAGMALRTGQELAETLAAALQDGKIGNHLWLFAYGSLMWKPDIAYGERRVATLRGWHRRFCLWQWRYRGTRANPNLMLALDRGGACKGVVYRIDGPDLERKLAGIWEREMIAYGYLSRWVEVRTDHGPVRALAFVANRGGERYAGRLPEADIAARIAAACGHAGAGAEYLLDTVLHCEQIGIHDRRLWRLQALVADLIAETCRNAASPKPGSTGGTSPST